MENNCDSAALLREISELRAALAEEKQRSERMFEAFRQLPVIIFAADDDGGLVFCNDEFHAVTGYDPSDVKDQAVLAGLMLPDPASGHALPLGFARREWRLKAKDGSDKVILWSDMRDCCPLPAWKRWGVGVDVTERARLARLRRDLERIIRHDLRTPLGVVVGYCDLLIEDGGLSEENREMVRRILRNGERMAAMIENSLALCRMEEGHFELRPEVVDLAATLSQISENLVPLTSGLGVTLDLRLDAAPLTPGTPFKVAGAPMLLENMLTNLIRNGLEAAPRNGRVSVDMTRRDGQVILTVHNPGEVPDSMRDRFFEAFATAGKAKGTGLGAYGARLIARAHGGDVTMTSDADQGTTLTVTLPG